MEKILKILWGFGFPECMNRLGADEHQRIQLRQQPPRTWQRLWIARGAKGHQWQSNRLQPLCTQSLDPHCCFALWACHHHPTRQLW